MGCLGGIFRASGGDFGDSRRGFGVPGVFWGFQGFFGVCRGVLRAPGQVLGDFRVFFWGAPRGFGVLGDFGTSRRGFFGIPGVFLGFHGFIFQDSRVFLRSVGKFWGLQRCVLRVSKGIMGF